MTFQRGWSCGRLSRVPWRPLCAPMLGAGQRPDGVAETEVGRYDQPLMNGVHGHRKRVRRWDVAWTAHYLTVLCYRWVAMRDSIQNAAQHGLTRMLRAERLQRHDETVDQGGLCPHLKR